MRVPDSNNYGTVRESINRSKGRLDKLQTQSATLKKINTPSDDPISTGKILGVRTDKMNNDQFQMNAKMAEALLSNTDHVLSDLSDIIVRAKEIAINQSSSASATAETRLGVAEEVQQLYLRAIASANRRIGDRYLLSGYKIQQPPVTEKGQYQGDLGESMVEIGRDLYIGVNLPGIEVFNTNPKASEDIVPLNGKVPGDDEPSRSLASREAGINYNIFKELQSLRIGLLTGEVETVRDTLDSFDAIHGKLNSLRAKLGSRINGIESTATSIERHNITNAQLTSQLEDADMAQVVSDLAKEETIFRSALQSSKSLIRPTLLEFLR